MSLHHHNPSHSNNTSDPLFELLADGPAIEPGQTYRRVLRERLMSFPPLAGLITFRLPVIGRVFLPRMVGTLGLVAIGAGMTALLVLWPFERPGSADSVSVSDRSARAVEQGAPGPPLPLAVQEGSSEADLSMAGDAAEPAFDPPRPLIRLPFEAPADAVRPPLAPGASIVAVQPTAIPPSIPTPAQSQAPPPRDESGRDRPVAPVTPVPTATVTVVQTGGEDIELPPTPTARPTSEGRPTLPPAFPTDTPTETPPETPPITPPITPLPSKTPEPTPTFSSAP